MPARATGSQPFTLIQPRSIAPVVLTCEHASHRLPRAAAGTPLQAVLASHWGWDLGAWQLTRELARRLSASAIGGRWSRLWIDLNRAVDDPTLIRDEAGGGGLPWNRAIRPDEVERRVLACHAPYHQAIDRLILRRLVRGVRPLLLAVHSFTPELDGRSRPFDIGILYAEHAGPAHQLGRALRDNGLSVRYNQPYSGREGMMYAAQRHGAHHRLVCLELEVNQGRFSRRGFTDRLARAVERGIGELLAAARARGRD